MDAIVLELAESRAAGCRALGNSRRLLIMWLLSHGELSVNEIAVRAGSSLQNVSQHLKLLRQASLVTTRREGQTILYRIADSEWIRQCPAVLQAPATLEKNQP